MSMLTIYMTVWLSLTDLSKLGMYGRVLTLDYDDGYSLANPSDPIFKGVKHAVIYHLSNDPNIIGGKIPVRATEYDLQCLRGTPGHTQDGGTLTDNLWKPTIHAFVSKFKDAIVLSAKIESGGEGGDQIANLIFASIDSVSFYTKFVQFKRDFEILTPVFDMKFDPDDIWSIQTQVNDYLSGLQRSELDSICPHLGGIMGSLSDMMGEWINAFSPSLFNENPMDSILKSNDPNGYSNLVDLYKGFPPALRELITDSSRLGRMLTDLLNSIQKILVKNPDEIKTPSSQSGGFGLSSFMGPSVLSVLGLDKAIYGKMLTVINERFQPSIKIAEQTIDIIFPAAFALLAVRDYCNRPRTTPDQIEHEMRNYLDYLKLL